MAASIESHPAMNGKGQRITSGWPYADDWQAGDDRQEGQ